MSIFSLIDLSKLIHLSAHVFCFLTLDVVEVDGELSFFSFFERKYLGSFIRSASIQGFALNELVS
jgi:hypothetical protein